MGARSHKGQSCRTCRYFGILPGWAQLNAIPENGTMGSCQRFPPEMTYDDCLNGEFPVVHSSMWCGEFSHGHADDVADNESL